MCKASALVDDDTGNTELAPKFVKRRKLHAHLRHRIEGGLKILLRRWRVKSGVLSST